MPEMIDLWTTLGNECLCQAYEIIKNEAISTRERVEIASKLANLAIELDAVNLRWERGNRLGASPYLEIRSGLPPKVN